MNRMRVVELESIVISTHKFIAPLNYIDNRRYIDAINKLAKAFGLSTEGSIYMGDTMYRCVMKSQWLIIVKGYENSVDLFLKEAKKITD